MKNRNFIKNSIIALLPISLGLGVLFGVNKKPIQLVEGYSSSSLPTTIDLNDTSESDIRSYYADLVGKTESERKGNNLLKNLKSILKNGQKYYSYDSGSAVWQIYEIADRDWEKSPATSISGYSSKTNKVTGYTYGTSTSSKGTNPYVHALYHNRDVTNQATAWDSHGERNNAWTIEREHVWPKSQGFEASGQGGARGDPMHLMAADGTSNGMHSNLFYGYVDKTKTYKDAGSTHSNCSGNLTGTSKTMGSNTVFEPQDSDKGDIARAIFYMVARYNYLSGSDNDGINANNPNLKLVQESNYYSSYTSSTTNAGKMGIMTDLLNWHHQDPVDSYEIHRNNLLYKNYTNNRNPFIDFPEWADYIWGSVNYNGRTYVSHSTTPTGSANPQTDTVHAFNEQSGGSTVVVTGVTLDESAITIEVGAADSLIATVAPSNATNKNVTWSSSDESVATVSNGTVRGVAEGTATITVTTEDGSKSANCTVTVTPTSGGGGETASNITINLETTGITSTGYDSGEERTWTQDGYSFGSKATLKSSTNIQAQASNGLFYNTTAFSNSIKSITLSQSDAKGWTLSCGSSSKLVNSTKGDYNVTGGSSDGITQPSSAATMKWTISDSKDYTYFALKRSGSNAATVSSIVIELNSSTDVSSIAIKTHPTLLTYTEGASFCPDGLVITATYANSSTQDISYEDNEDFFDFEPYDNLQLSDTSITISYGGKTCTQTITVNESTKTLTSISLSGQDTAFVEGDEWEFGGVVTARFSDGSEIDVTTESTFSGYNTSNIGDQTVTVSYTYKAVTKTKTYTITVEAAPEYFSQRVVSKSSSKYFETGAIYLSGSGTEASASCDAFTITQYKDTSTADVPLTYNEIRVYTNHTVTIVPNSGYIITSAVIKANSSDYASAVGSKALSNCTLTTGSENTVTLTPTTMTSFGFSNGAQSRLNYIVINYQKAVSYSIVTDPTTLRTGDDILLVGTNGTYYGEAKTITSNYLTDISAEPPVDGNIYKRDSATSFRVVRDGNYVSFLDQEEGYLSAYGGSNVGIKYVESSSNRTRLSLTINSSGVVTDCSTEDTSYTHRNLRYNYNSGNPRFAFYGSTTYSSTFSIYKKSVQVEADTWSSTFLTSTYNCDTDDWSALASEYDLLSSKAKQEIVSCEAVNNANYSLRSQAMARYEYILGDARFNSGLSNFIIGRNVSTAQPHVSPILFAGKTNNVVVIIVVSVISVSAIGGYFFMRSKRKEEF